MSFRHSLLTLLNRFKEYVPGVLNPDSKSVHTWNKCFVISCMIAVIIDPLYVFLIRADEDEKCTSISWKVTIPLVCFRTLTDMLYILHMLLQFRLTYVVPGSRMVGPAEIVNQPKKIALNYLFGNFLIDLINVLPISQITVLSIVSGRSKETNKAMNILCLVVFLQYFPRLYRVLSLLAGRSLNGFFIYESVKTNFIINTLSFLLVGHVIGSCWYLLGIQRLNQCLLEACHSSKMQSCSNLIDCWQATFLPHEKTAKWRLNEMASSCFSSNGDFPYGIYMPVLKISTRNIITKYLYSLFWGFQQISTLGGKQTPSNYNGEIIFAIVIIGLGLFFLALMIGNMQSFRQSIGQRRSDMLLRRRDLEAWMRYRQLPEDLRREIRDAEQYSATTMNEEDIVRTASD